MTLSYPLPRETRQTAILDGNGSTGPYGPTAFKVFDVLDVKVWRKDADDDAFVDVTATSTIEKTADLAWDTVSVTLATSAPDTSDIVIQGSRTAERSASVLRGSSLDGDQLEKELTKIATTHSELRRDVDRRAAFQLDHDGDTSLPAWEAGMALAWHGTDRKLVNVETAATAAATAAAAAVTATSAAGTATTQAGISTAQAAAASASADDAFAWAEEDEDVEVAPGLYSAKHWAAKSAESAAEAEGDVSGPASSVADRLAAFSGTTGKLLYDSGKTTADFATAAQGAQAASALQPTAIATFAQYNSATAGKILASESVWANLGVLTDGAAIAVNFNDGYDFGGASNLPLTLGGNRTLSAPSNARNGKKGILWFLATGSTRTLTLNAAWLVASGVETGPYSITTSQALGLAYVTVGAYVVVTGVIRVSLP